MQGRDVRAIAEPGSGKTLGYLLPALPWLKKRIGTNDDAFSSGPGVLILVPTRYTYFVKSLDMAECILLWKSGHFCCAALKPLVIFPYRELAQQVAACCRNLQGLFNLRTACIFGGGNRSSQVSHRSTGTCIWYLAAGRLLPS